MINRSLGPLYEKLDDAHEQMRCARSSDEKLAMANYIGNLYRSLICMGDGSVKIDKYRCFGGRKNYHKFLKKLDIYTDDLLHNFVLCKDFHASYFGEVLPVVEEEMQKFFTRTFPKDEDFSPKDFYDILYLFLTEYGLEEKFDSFYKNQHIHSTIIGQDKGNLGFTLHNPINLETDLFIRDFQYDFSTMNTLVHELGHGIDLVDYPQDISSYNQYFYLSFYGEVLPRIMERLLHRYLIKNGICTNTVKTNFIDFESLNHDFLLEAYILSLLDSTFLLNGRYVEEDSELIAKKVKKYFLEGADIQEFIERMGSLDLADAYNYAYGDILSLFLCDEIEQVGFSSDLFQEFMKKRSSLFQPEFLRELGFGPGNYKKLYKKEVELLKK